jgi:hypothetical protein
MNEHSPDREPAGQPARQASTDGTDTRIEAGQQALAASDAGLARVTEDLIDILIQRGLIQITDFAPAAQAKLLARRRQRESLGRQLDLLDDDAGVL